MSAENPTLSPGALQVLDFVGRFLSEELMPAQADPKLRFRTRVAASLLQSARRELELQGQFPMDVGSLRSLAENLRQGRCELTDPDIYEMSVRLVEAKLAIVTGGE
jgi:hypothetical protein